MAMGRTVGGGRAARHLLLLLLLAVSCAMLHASASQHIPAALFRPGGGLSFEREASDSWVGNFTYSTFDSENEDDFEFNGSAMLNADHSVLSIANGTFDAGSIYYQSPVLLSEGFVTTFNVSMFSFTTGQGNEAPEGFTMIFSGASFQALGDSGAGLGYAASTANGTDGIDSSLVVEFDFHTDAVMNDPSYAHVSVHSRFNSSLPNSADEVYSIGLAQLPYAASGLAQTHVVDIEYSSSNQSLSIAMDGAEVLYISDLVLATAVSGDSGFIGFTASDGLNNAATYWINSWSFSNSDAEGSSDDIDSNGDSEDSGITPLGIFAVCGGLFLCVALCCLVIITIVISSEDLRNAISAKLKRSSAPQPYVPVSQEDDYTSALGIN